MAYFFASPIDVDIKLEGEEQRKQVEIKGEKEKTISCPVYYDGDSVTGQVSNASLVGYLVFGIDRNANYSKKITLRVRDGKKTAHEGIKVEFVGSIGLLSSGAISRSIHQYTCRVIL